VSKFIRWIENVSDIFDKKQLNGANIKTRTRIDPKFIVLYHMTAKMYHLDSKFRYRFARTVRFNERTDLFDFNNFSRPRKKERQLKETLTALSILDHVVSIY
jgi:hypothetical protein